MSQAELKKAAAVSALQFVKENDVVGVGTGSTVNFFIDALAKSRIPIEGVVVSSKASMERLMQYGFEILDPNTATHFPVYVDGADEINSRLQMIKGGGGALTGEKIVASLARKFVCIADSSKKVDVLGQFPVAVEVIPLARSFVGREIVKLGGDPVYRQGVVTDYGNVILDAYFSSILEPIKLEETLNNIAGVVTNGLFAKNPADVLLLGTEEGVKEISL